MDLFENVVTIFIFIAIANSVLGALFGKKNKKGEKSKPGIFNLNSIIEKYNTLNYDTTKPAKNTTRMKKRDNSSKTKKETVDLISEAEDNKEAVFIKAETADTQENIKDLTMRDYYYYRELLSPPMSKRKGNFKWRN